MRAYGAKVVLTPAAERASGAVRLAEQLSKERGWFLARQFDNEANPAYHRQTTGPEILSGFAGRRLKPVAWNSHDGSLVPAEIVAGSDGACTVRVGPRGYVVYAPA